MVIRRLEITDIRNIRQASLSDLSPVNIFYGFNGSGKTSVLEAIYMLSLARSFRSHKIKPVINNDSQQCVVYAEVVSPESEHYQTLGIQRSRSQGGLIKLDGSTVRNASVLAEALPVQVINSDAFLLLEGGPSVRRQFLDWGVFHVEHGFHGVWKGAQRCLKQRNTLLRHGRISGADLDVWTTELIKHAEQLDGYRRRYIEAFEPVFRRCLAELIELEGLELHYQRGWAKDALLADLLSDNKQREAEQGRTLYGPHRADIRIKYQGNLAADILSRGQQKLIVCALRVAQGYLLSQLNGRKCVYLVDDLPSELDARHRQALCSLLEELQCQVFISCVDDKDLLSYWSNRDQLKRFHVEHGQITEVPIAV